jgi:hypothetical protein
MTQESEFIMGTPIGKILLMPNNTVEMDAIYYQHFLTCVLTPRLKNGNVEKPV